LGAAVVRENPVFSRWNCLRLGRESRRLPRKESKSKEGRPVYACTRKERKSVSAKERRRAEFVCKDGFRTMNWQEKSGKLWRSYGPHALVIFVVVLMVHDIFGPHGFLAMRQKQQEIQKVSSVLQRLNKENSLLEQDVQDLKSDPQTIRKIAREELGLAQPGEIIIKLPVPEPQTTTAKP